MSPKREGGRDNVEGGGQKLRKGTKDTPKRKKRKKDARPGEPPIVIDPDLALVIKKPMRVHIVAEGHQRLISPSEFAREMGYSLSTVSAEFRVLANADYLELVEEVQVRGATKHMYRSVQRAFVSDIDWSCFTKPVKESWNDAFLKDLNGRFADAAEAKTINSRDDRCLYWLAMTLDETSWPEFIKMLEWAIKEGEELGVETANRRARGEGNGSIPVTFGVLGFESPKESQRKRKPKQRREPPPKGRKKADGKGEGGKPKRKPKPKAKAKSRARGKGKKGKSS